MQQAGAGVPERTGPAPGLRVVASGPVQEAAQAWIARVREGDAAAFDAIVRHYQADVQRLCRRLLGSPTEAEDAAQEAFLRVHAALARYDAERPFRPWLLAIAARRAIDLLRRRRREERLFEPGPADPEAAEHPGASPLQHGLGAERRARLLAEIEALPDRYRAPLALRYYADLDFAEIAELLGVSRNQVATLLHRGRLRLREALAGERP